MQQELASISEVVWLSAPDTLDCADALLSGLGYYTTHRSDFHLTAQRPGSTSDTEQDTYMLTVSASPQAGGGVKVAVKGDDREAWKRTKRSGQNGLPPCPRRAR
jgi:hypothetical protein